MTVLVTGVAGFIGSSTARALLARGDRVVGIDNINDYYDPSLKRARLERLSADFGDRFQFKQIDFANSAALDELGGSSDFDRIVHLGAQAGVRYSLENPQAYVQSNLVGHCNMLELARHRRSSHFVYASSSSVYGGNKSLPFRVEDRVDHPLSLYAASKKADELMSGGLCKPVPAAVDGIALLHRLRAMGQAGHGHVDLHQGPVRGRAAAFVQSWRDAARFHLHRRYRCGSACLPRWTAWR